MRARVSLGFRARVRARARARARARVRVRGGTDASSCHSARSSLPESSRSKAAKSRSVCALEGGVSTCGMYCVTLL